MIKKLISSTLVILHILTFGHVADTLAALAQSASYKLDAAAYSYGTPNKTSSTYKLALDSAAEASMGVYTSANFKLNAGYVYVAQTNPPELTQTIPNFSWQENGSMPNAFDLDDYFTSPDSLSLIYTVSGNTDITVSIDPISHLVSFSQPTTWNGTETISFTATDTESNSATSNPVSLQVEGVDNLPVLDFISDITVDETQLVKITPHAADLDGDTITYTYTAPLDANGEWQTNYTSAGVYTITVTATDSSSLHLTDTQEVTITVTNVNRAPVITQINGIAITPGVTVVLPDVNENTTLEITPTATDADNETILYSYTSPIDSSGTWLIDYNQAGTHTFTVTAFDGITPVEQDVQVTVLNVNRPPEITLTLSKDRVKPDEDFKITLTAQDPDSDTMTYVIKKDGGDLDSGTISEPVEKTTKFLDKGVHTISAIVTDTGGAQVSAEAPIEVYDPNENRDAINPVMGDFDGDAISELGIHNCETGTWEISYYDTTEKKIKLATPNPVWLSGFGTSKDFWPVGGDFNGDGLTDIGTYNNTNGELKVALSDGDSFTEQPAAWIPSSGTSYSWIPLTGNFNGDKYTDFCLYNKDNGDWKIAKGTGTGFDAFSPWLSGFGGTDYTPLTGDFNADGLTDIMIFKKSSGEFKVAFSNNHIFIAQTTPWITGYATEKDPIISDFNNDGLTDIGYFDKSASKWFYALNTSTTFVDSGEWLTGFGGADVDSGHTGDFNGDGLTDAATFDKDPLSERWVVCLSTKKPIDLLVEVDNGIGGKTEITYEYAATLNNELLPFPVYVAKEIRSINTAPADRAATYTQTFTYEGGWFDAEEREFRGFRMIRATDSASGNYTETYFYQGKPPQDGALKGQIEKILAFDSSANLISQAVNTWDVRKAGPTDGVLGFPYLKEVTQTVYEYGATSPVSTKNQFSYDNVGNITSEICLGDLSVTGDEKSTETKYLLPYAQGHNRPEEILLKDKDGIVVNKKIFEYYSEGNLKKETAYLDGVNDPSTQYDYDSFGNVTSTTNAQDHTVTTSYETTFYTYPETISNELGHSIHYQYNTKFGVVTHLTDVNDRITETVYDTLGRITEQKNTQGQPVTTYSYPDFNTKVTTQLGISKTEYIDGLGRAYKTVSDGEDGAIKRQVQTIIYFNNRGLKESETLPHYVGDTPQTISYEYDQRGRVHITKAFPGTIAEATTIINYLEPLYTETIDPKGAVKRVRKDVYGNTILVEEHVRNQYPGVESGVFTTTYEYDLKGNLTKLTDSKGNITQIQYDTLGRKISLNDPDTGITTYTYDKLGNLLTQTDNKDQTLTMEYDELSRLKFKKHGATTLATYDYDDTSKTDCLGRLSKITDQNGNINSYYYDTEGRTIKVDKTIDSVAYITQTAYDLIGRTTSITYPDNEVVNYTYDANSGLLEHVHGTNIYVEDITYNAKGQIKTITYGNGVQTDYNYGTDLRLSQILSQKPGSPALQDLNYTFDDNGNITQLVDNLRSNIRTYEYDDLNRLVWARNTPNPSGGYTDFNYNYNSIGNMTYKSDTGFLTYPTTPFAIIQQGQMPCIPHAVRTAGSNNYTYDVNGNMLTSPNKIMAYDIENRMISLETSTETTVFTYDVDGGRIKKQAGANYTIYVNSLYEKDQAGKTTKYIFAGSNRVCSIESTGSTYYYHGDHLGSSNIITDATGVQVQHCEYTPYGTTARNEGTDVVTRKFTGKELDSTGLYFYAWRYYDPSIGRFIQPDTIIPQPYNPQTLNRYSYCDNNPLNYTDPSGHWSWKKFFNSAIGALIGGIIVAVLTLPSFGFSLAAAGFYGGMVGGAVTGALNGGARGALIGGIMGGVLGAFGGWGIDKFGSNFGYGMLGAGAAYAGATDSWDSFAGGFIGGTIGYAFGSGAGTFAKNQRAIARKAEYGGYKGPSENQENLNIDKGIDDLSGTKWSKQPNGRRITEALKVANSEDRIQVQRLDGRTRAITKGDRIYINPSEKQVSLPGRLAHEGTHMLRYQEGKIYGLLEERAAFTNGFAVDFELNPAGAFNPTTDWISKQYEDDF